jgi:glyoxylase-like metal-dependent hydrolase (beta-lactamase superfamily II)
MRIHHLNCVSSCPIGGALMDGRSKASLHARLTCHCLLLETAEQLLLVDTGYGLRDVASPRTRLSRVFLELLRPELREEMTAIRQIERLGFKSTDVRHVVLTHLDFDHAGGLDDFPHAQVHLLAAERDVAVAQRTTLDRMRYRPAQWSTQPNWQLYAAASGESWFGFDRVRELAGVGSDVLLVPLVGHTMGHAGVAVRREHDWLLQAGDAYFYYAEMDVTHPSCTPGLRAYQTMMEQDRKQRLGNQERLRELRRRHGAEVAVCCSHDAREFEALSGRSSDAPAGGASAAPAAEPVGEAWQPA